MHCLRTTAFKTTFESISNASLAQLVGTVTGRSSRGKIFYPFTFPITAGPGTLVVMLTLSARVSNKGLPETAAGHAGIVLAAMVLSMSVYICYGYAPRLIKAVSPSTVLGILRVIAFILMCIGVQITWNGISMLNATLTNHR